MWDNSETLISYIHHTFVTCDDTGICEDTLKFPKAINGEKPGAIVVLNDVRQSTTRYDYGLEDEDGHDGSSTSEHSPDIHTDVGHRRRSETSKRLETLKLQRLAQSKIKTVQWREPPTLNSIPGNFEGAKSTDTISINGLDGLISGFNRVCEKDIKPRTSAVSKLIKACPNLPLNPFQEFMKYDGNACVSGPSKTVRVFPLMASSMSDRHKALEVCVSGIAKVSDLIGLICFHYTSKGLTPKLSTDISRYALYVAEDTGEVDSDLPARSPHESVSRFHFPYLALVDKGSSADAAASQSPEIGKKYNVTVHVSTGEKIKLELKSFDTPLRTVRDSALIARMAKNDKINKDMEYNIEKLTEPNSPLSLDLTVNNTGVTEFALIRAHSARGDLMPQPSTSAVAKNGSSIFKPSSPCQTTCNTYLVSMIRKFKRDIKVRLTISKERFEVSPVPSEERKLSSSSAAKLFKSLQRHSMGNGDFNALSTQTSTSVNFPMNRIGGAEIVDEKSGRKVFRIVHNRVSSSGNVNEWKSHQFEAEPNVALEIVQTLNKYLDSSPGEVRYEFLRRTPRKSSFFKKLQLSDLSFGDSGAGMIHQS